MAQRGGHPSHLLVKGEFTLRPYSVPILCPGGVWPVGCCVLLPDCTQLTRGGGDSLLRCGGRQIRRQLPMER